MAVKICPVCGANEKCKIKVANGCICASCTRLSPNYSAETIEVLKGYQQEQIKRRSVFSKTRIIKSILSDTIIVDENNKLFYKGKEKDENPIIYRFDEVIGCNFESQPGQFVTKKKGGLGRAVVGGALFGGVGAMVGASTAKAVTTQQNGPSHLKVQMNAYSGVFVITLYNPPTGADQFFNVCAATVRKAPAVQSGADEILKYKKLLDEGIITPEQFEAKKRELLNI